MLTWAPAAASVEVEVSGQWGGAATQQVQLPAGEGSVMLTMRAAAADISLWWPGKHGGSWS